MSWKQDALDRLRAALEQLREATRPAPSPQRSSRVERAPAAPMADEPSMERRGDRVRGTRARQSERASATTTGDTSARLRAPLRARLHEPRALREAVVLKEILDTPLALRRRR
ncbi:MAG: hypothetical protein KDK91_24055 [Gammaproteobacteria bacterium]|nr:hypothetical protein [Gammaproteobacteria bacterium]